jgi:hypothetical protein
LVAGAMRGKRVAKVKQRLQHERSDERRIAIMPSTLHSRDGAFLFPTAKRFS